MGQLQRTEATPGEKKHVMAVDELSQYLTFHVQGERLAIGILDVKEIIEVGVMTRVPMTPEFIQGVINLRGNVVPVINLAARLGRPVSRIGKRNCIVLVEVDTGGEQQVAGMLVDEVNEILEIPETCMQPAPDFGADIRTEFIKRMGRVGDEFIILLDIDHVLNVGELSEQLRQGRGDHRKGRPLLEKLPEH